MPATLSGVIERVVFHNPESGYAVLRVEAGRKHGGATVVGNIPAVYAGEFVEADGEWVQDRDHGLQFKATSLRITPPNTKEGIVKFLASGLIKGIGAHYAKKIVDVFGDRTLQVIDESPAFLSEVRGIGSKRLKQIRASWESQRSVRDIIVFLHSHGVGTARAVRIYKTYGDKAIDRSPCGTGTSARMAQLAAKGRLKVGDDFIHESIIGSLFNGRVEAAARVGNHEAIIPSIEGWARITGYNTIFIDDRDPYRHGFQVT